MRRAEREGEGPGDAVGSLCGGTAGVSGLSPAMAYYGGYPNMLRPTMVPGCSPRQKRSRPVKGPWMQKPATGGTVRLPIGTYRKHRLTVPDGPQNGTPTDPHAATQIAEDQ